MVYDLTKSHFSLSLQKDVETGSVVDREGVLLQAVLEGGVEKVKKAEAAGSLNLIGFAISDNETVGETTKVETFTVPAAPGPYAVQLSGFPLSGLAVPNAQIRVSASTTGELTQANAGPASGEFLPDAASGVVLFHVDQAGEAVTVSYKHQLTVAQSRQTFFQRNINNEAGAIFNTVVVGQGVGEVWTQEFDMTVDWAGSVVPHSGPDGIIANGGGTAIHGAKVVHVPDEDNAMLGISFSLPG